MNIIKENLFFVVMGAVVLLALVLFVAVVQPLKSKNSDLDAKVEGLVKSLRELVGHTTAQAVVLPNKAALEAAKTYRAEYEDQLKQMTAKMADMRLSSDLPNLGPAERNEPGAFKVVYEQDINGLKKQLSEKRITTVPNTWAFWSWGEGVPSDPAQRVLAAKEFSLISELITIVGSPELHVLQVDHVEVNPGEARGSDLRGPAMGYTAPGSSTSTAQPRVDPYFDVFPFVLEVRMPIERYEILLRELLRSSKEIPIPIYVRKVSMARIDDDPRVTRKIPPLYVAIRIEGWALDYRVETAAQPAAGGGVMGGLRRPGR